MKAFEIKYFHSDYSKKTVRVVAVDKEALQILKNK